MRFPRYFIGLFTAAGLVFVGCSDEKKPAASAPEQKATASADAEAQNASQANGDGNNAATKVHPDCGAPRSDGPTESFAVGGRNFERKGSTLTLKTEDPDDEFVVGQISDVKDFTPENKANVEVALKWFADQKVDAIAVSGDLGETQSSIENVLRTVAAPGFPVLAIIGNRECRDHFTQAVATVQKEHKNVINMNHVRVFNADDASIVSLPGYFNRSYTHCAEGCVYGPEQVQGLDAFAEDTSAPIRVLLGHGPPKMDGALGLDRIHEGVNVGDPALAAYLKNGKFPIGLFGNIQEAGGYATDLSGKNRVEKNVFVDSLYLNPGPIDSVRWQMLDGSESLGMAGIVRIKGKQASYDVYRIRKGEAKVDAN